MGPAGLALCAWGSLGLSGIWAGQTAPAPELGSLAEFYSLPQARVQQGLPVRVKCQVLCYDPDWNLLYLHEGTNAWYFEPRTFPQGLKAGQVIELTARSCVGGSGPYLTNLAIKDLGPAKLPAATRLEISALGVPMGQWVESSGTVRVAETSRGRLGLVMEDKGRDCQVFVMGQPGTNDNKRLVGSKVQVRGIDSSKVRDGRVESAEITAPGIEEVTILEAGSLNLSAAPVVSIGALLNRELGDWTNRPVRINGWAAACKPGEYLVVRDPTGVMRAQVVQMTQVGLKDRVEVWGWLGVLAGETVLKHAYFETAPPSEIVPAAKSPPALAASPRSAIPLRTLTTIAEIVALKPQEAALGYPVRVRGVLTYADPGWRNAFIQDEKDAVYVDLALPEAQAGQWVEITGRTDSGRFMPQVQATALTVLGRTNLPAPVKVDLQDMATGCLDARWVEIQGVVRRVNFDSEDGRATLSLTTRYGRFNAIVFGLRGGELPANLVDSLVSVQGACGSELNARNQLTGITLHVPGPDRVRVLEPAPADPFAARSLPIGTVATFDPERPGGRRVKVSGVLTALLPGEGFVVQDSSGGIRVRVPERSGLHPGDAVDVLGFPTMGDFSPSLEEVTLRRTGTGPLPSPHRTTASQILSQGTEDATLVTLEGRLLQPVPRSARPKLVLQDGPITFTAQMGRWMPGRECPDFKVGSLLRLQGLCSIQGNEGHDPESFRLLLAGPEDLLLVSAPSWWTPRRMCLLAGTLILVILLVLGWVALLHRQVQAQTEVIRHQLEEGRQTAASLAREKNLLAHERDLLGTLLDNVPDLIYFKDLESRFVRLSKSKVEFSFALVLGRHRAGQAGNDGQELPPHLASREQFAQFLIGKSDFDVYDVARARSAYTDEQEIIRTGQPIIGKAEHTVCPDRKVLWILTTKMPWRDKDGRIIGTFGVSKDITAIKEAEDKLQELHRELVEASRQAGMAEVASSVLHNVRNVLNSVNVSASLILNQSKGSKLPNLARAAALLGEHAGDLGQFLTADPRGQRLPAYLGQLAQHLAGEQEALLNEARSLVQNVEHIKEIVSVQQGYAKALGVAETVRATELVEDALRMNASALARHDVQLSRQYDPNVPAITVERHKVLQVLVNLIRNAEYACDESGRPDKRLTVKVANGGGMVRIMVSDNGVGIPAENLTRIFNHGFTTRKNGHGFGLHSGALAAKEMGGALLAESGGPGQGATFTLELPLQRN